MTQRKPGQPSKLWLAFVEDGFEMAIAIAFGIFGIASLGFLGLAAGHVVLTPPSIQETSTYIMIVIWGLTTTAGLAAPVGRVLEWERLELSGLASLGFSCLFYLVAIIGVAGIGGVGATVLLIAVLAGCLFRMYVIRKSIKGQKMVTHIVEELRHNGHGEQL